MNFLIGYAQYIADFEGQRGEWFHVGIFGFWLLEIHFEQCRSENRKEVAKGAKSIKEQWTNGTMRAKPPELNQANQTTYQVL